MLFNSYIYILLFIPVTIAVYFLLNRKPGREYGKLFLIAASFVFILFSGLGAAAVLAADVAVNYHLNSLIRRKKSKKILSLGVIFNILLLAAFKYSGAFEPLRAMGIALPVGLSFYTFQQIAFLVDNYRGEIPDYSLTDYTLFSVFFPKLVQGPIPYHSELLPQFASKEKKHFSADNFSRGLMLFSIGLGKKVLLADNFGKIVDYGFSSTGSLNSFEAVLTVLAYTLQIYLDFSGYCDMAAGSAKMLNIDLPVNFDSPYKALNISDFWKRWHITLTRFLTKYIYIPLGGNRKGAVRTYVNIIIVFLVSGLWHGVGLTFIIWGLLHGVASALYRLIKKGYDKIPGMIRWLVTFCFVNITWVFFRAPDLSSAEALLRRIFTGGWRFEINAELTETLLMPTLINVPSQIIPFVYVITALTVGTVVCCALCKNSNEIVKNFKPNFKTLIIAYLLLTFGILSLSGVGAFLYTNF